MSDYEKPTELHGNTRTRKHRPKGTDPAKVGALLAKGCTHGEAAKVLGISRQAVDKLAKRYKLDPEGVQEFRRHKGVILDNMQARLIGSITDEEIAKMAPRDRILAFGVIYDKTRLEKGESTSNLSLFSRAVIAACEDTPQKEVKL